MARMGNQSWLIRALVTILLLIIVKTSTTSAATSNDCLNQCSLTATTDSINKFLALKKQNKFRIITLTLAINNDTNGLSLAANLASSYEADKWVWALETYGRSYLALPFDINIFSMGTLTLFQRTATINITATPNNCLASLNETCKRKVIGRFLSGITQTDYNLHMMCHRVAQSEAFLWLVQNQLAYECCNELDSLSGSWDCNHPVELNGWLNILYVMIYASIVLVVLYVPEKILNEVSEEYERWFYRSKRKKPRSSSRQNKKQQQANNNNGYGISHQDEPDASKQHKISIQDDKELATFNKRNLRQLFDFDKYSYTELIILDGDVPFQVLPKRWNWKTNRCYQILFILLSPIVIVIFLALQLTINRQLFERVYLTNLTQQQLYEYLIPAVCGGFGLFVIVGAWIVATLTTDSLTNNVFIDWLDDLQVVEEDDSDDDDEERKEEKSNLPAIFSTHGSHEIVKFHRTVAKNRSLLFSSTYWSNYRIWVWDTPIQYWTAAKKQMLQSVNMYEQLFSCIGFTLATGLLPVVVLILCLPVFVVFLLMPIPLVYCFLTSIAGVHKILSRKITGLCNILLIIIFFICSLYFYIILIGLLAVSAYLILYTFAFTVVGIIVNADVSTPYLIFIVIIIYYLFSVISDRYVRKQKLKKLAFEICEKLESNRESQFSLDKQREILGKAVVDDQQQNKPETRRKHRKYTLPPLKMKNSRIDPIDIPKQPLYDDEETSLDQTFTPLQKIKTLFFEDHHGAAYVPLAVYKEVCAQHLGSSRRTFI
ncbi:hypothetical protein TrispH2_003207 [Trichoplax sp. H2]|nr:hypothetical protein TrispH2_003207 [Trichoplax sp. H2]|eukprot:RDD45010.1 hypothetical protein TrispH2_003207 [Trichoplax sp. H2]